MVLQLALLSDQKQKRTAGKKRCTEEDIGMREEDGGRRK